MIDQEDNFYKTLPFTLSPEQSTPNYVIFGTGLQECLIAAHLSKLQNKPGLVLDLQKSYGSCLKAVTIKQLFSLTELKSKLNLYNFVQLDEQKQNKNRQFQKEVIEQKSHRGFNIDLEPNLFFANSISCDMLKQADMDKYMDFRIVNSMLHYDNKSFKHVPLSKGKIFQTKDLSLLEKKLLLNTFHSLTQIYHRFLNLSEDQNSTKQFDKDFAQVDEKLYEQFVQQKQQTFSNFLQKLTKNNKKIMNYLVYIIANYQHNYKSQIPEFRKEEYSLLAFIKRFGRFVKSCGIYGQCPYLYVDNGIGDVPQAFSRIASIYLSTYILHPCISIKQISTNLQNTQESNQQNNSHQNIKNLQIACNLVNDGNIKTSKIYYGPSLYHLKHSQDDKYDKQYTLRLILLCKKIGKEQECPAIVYITQLQQGQNPIYLFMFDAISHNCPQNFILYQFQTILKNGESKDQATVRQKVNKMIQILENVRGEEFKQSICYTVSYVRQKRYSKNKYTGKQSQILLNDSIGFDLDSYFVNFKQIVGQQSSYFKKEGQQSHGDEQWGGQNQTVCLINKLQNIDVTTKQQNATQVIQNQIIKQNKQTHVEGEADIQHMNQQKQKEKQTNLQMKLNENMDQPHSQSVNNQ